VYSYHDYVCSQCLQYTDVPKLVFIN